MADSRYAGEAGLQAVFGQIKAAIAEKQDKINGMGLSHNDYSNEEKQKNAQNVSDIVELNSDIDNIIEKMDGDATTYPYADVITIEDAIPANLADCKVKIEPVQDLHGYDHPWVGGAGKNKLPLMLADIKAANTSGTWSGNAYILNGVTFTVQTDSDGNVMGIKVNGTASASMDFILFDGDSFPFDINESYTLNGCVSGGGNSTYKIDIYYIKSYTPATFSNDYGNGATSSYAILDGATAVKVRLVVYSGTVISNQIFYPMIRKSTETDATFAPYTNICPISGHTEASVQRDGKNLFDASKAMDGKYWAETLKSNQDFFCSELITVKPGETYYTNANTFNRIMRVDMFDAYKNHIGNAGNNTDAPITFTVADNARYIGVSCLKSKLSPSEMVVYKNVGNVADYEPYAGKTYTIAFGDAIYGGTVRINSNGNTVMDVDRAIVDAGDLTYNEGSVAFYSSDITDFKRSGSIGNKYATYCISSAFEYHGNSDYEQDANGFSLYYNPSVPGCRLAFNKTIFDGYTTTQFKQWLTDNNVQVCYELATPTTIQLTPQQIQLLKGTNTLTASTGDISVTVNGVSGSIGAVQEQVNELAEKVDPIPIIRKGAVNFTDLAVDNVFSSDIAFDTPMPNADYTVTASSSGTTVAVCNIGNRTVNGFTVYVRNIGTAAIGGAVMWQVIG